MKMKVKVLVTQLCPTLCNPMGCSPGSSGHEILQARIPEWVAIPFCMGAFNPGIKPRSPSQQADSLSSEPPGEALMVSTYFEKNSSKYL